jgi:prophage regulatory protein
MAKILLRKPEVIRRTGSSSSDIYDGMNKGTFPRSVPIGKRTVGWVEDEIQAWIDARIAQRDSREQRHRKTKAGPGRGHKGPMQTTVSTS